MKRIRKTEFSLFLFLYLLMIVLPLFFVLFSSFKSNDELFQSPWNLPDSLSLSTYADLFSVHGFGKYLANSFYFSIAAVVSTVSVSLLACYPLTRMKWKFRNLVMALFLLGIAIPIHSQVIPLYIMNSKLGIGNPKFSLIGIFMSFNLPMSLFILSGFMRKIPQSLEESAVIEGCSLFESFYRVIIPLMNPAIVTITIFIFINVWNDYFTSLIFISDDRHRTIQLGIARFKSALGTDYKFLLSAIIIGVLPISLVYLFIQKQIINGMTAGAVKG